MIKNKKRNFVFKVCTLFVMALLCIVSFVIPTKAYYQDENGNLVSNNLISNEFNYDVTERTFDSYYIAHVYTLNDFISENGVYSFSISYIQSVTNSCAIELRSNGSFISANLGSELNGRLIINNINIDLTNTYHIRVFATYQTGATKSIKFYNSMLNIGSNVLTYEPYGTYYSQTNYDNYGAIQYGTGYTDGKNSVYDSLTYQNISRLVSSVSLGKYDTANETFIIRPNINSFTFEQSDCVVSWSTSSSDVGYWYHLVLTWNTNSVIKDVGFTPSYFTNVILDINGYQMSNVNYNGSYFGFFNINEQYNEPCNTITLMFKMNSNAENFENVRINIQGFNSDIQASSELYNEGYEQGINVGKAEGYSIGYSEGVNQATENVIGWKGLFFSMADLPFKTVSNFLGFEVLGVNLFKAFIGFITVLGILWVFKRLVK